VEQVEDLPAYTALYNQIRTARLQRVRGARSSVQPDGTTVLLHPDTLETIQINLTGSAVWDLLDGERSTEEVVEVVVRLCAEATQAANFIIDEAGTNVLKDRLQAFLVSLVDKGFVWLDPAAARSPGVGEVSWGDRAGASQAFADDIVNPPVIAALH
jgi:hypothetical protein